MILFIFFELVYFKTIKRYRNRMNKNLVLTELKNNMIKFLNQYIMVCFSG